MEKLAPGKLTLEVRPSAFLGLNRAFSALCGLRGQPRSWTGTWRTGGELGFAQRELGWRWEKSLLEVCGPRHAKEEHGLKFKAPGVCSQIAEASWVHKAPSPENLPSPSPNSGGRCHLHTALFKASCALCWSSAHTALPGIRLHPRT